MKEHAARAGTGVSPLRILVRGSGDVGSAVAHLLFGAGYTVIIHDIPQPTVTRRKMAFTDAIFEGATLLDGVWAQRTDSLDDLELLLAVNRLVPIITLPLPSILESLSPAVLVDARMRKHQQPETQIGLAPLTLGLGPNFTTGETVHLAVETGRGESLGRVISHGTTDPLHGEPKDINGHARDRYVYAPLAGVFHTNLQIGASVSQGQEIARIDRTPLFAPITGVLRGLTRAGVPVVLKSKVIEIDPRQADAQTMGIAERPARIAQGVLQAIRDWEQGRADRS